VRLVSGRELANGNLFSTLVFVEPKIGQIVSFNKGTGAFHAGIPIWGGRFLICRIRVFNHADILQFENRLTVPF